jgi:RimJ/RimL family protein N-acetyltransferase
VVDYHVDRPEVEAPQGAELTGTNRSEILINYATLLVATLEVLLCTVFGPKNGYAVSGSQISRRDRLELRLAIATGIKYNKFLAPMAAGFHPFPSRTRQLSPSAPMIVGPQGPSKVGRCQIKDTRARRNETTGSRFSSDEALQVIETPRLRLRPWIDADVEAWVEMNADPRVTEFFVAPVPRERSLEQAAKIRAELDHNGYGWWVIERKDVPGFAGVVVLDDIRWEPPFEPRREIGWRLPVHAWGQGFATEAASAVMKYGFESLGWPEVVAITSRLNMRSRRVMEKLGMMRDSSCDFEHPRIPVGHRLRPHVLYRKSATAGENC